MEGHSRSLMLIATTGITGVFGAWGRSKEVRPSVTGHFGTTILCCCCCCCCSDMALEAPDAIMV